MSTEPKPTNFSRIVRIAIINQVYILEIFTHTHISKNDDDEDNNHANHT